MTDAEIDLAIAKIEYPEGICQNLTSELTGNTITFISGVQGVHSVGYCNNWFGIGPIIEREGISIIYDGYKWSAYCMTGDSEEISEDADTPTKAAALCYLKMEGVSDE
jgi:hypothetical protein